jgi:tRNA modification GTPase
VRVVIYGATNAGKSSLLNRLLGYDRAIVSDSPGTTRDTIEEVINLRGIPIRITDTAGLRPPLDAVEREGMSRTEKSLELGDLLLHIVDRNAPKPSDFAERPTEQTELLLLNKSDLPEDADWSDSDALRISCVTEEGLLDLEEKIIERITKKSLRAQSAVAINTRHRDCLRRARESLDRARKEFGEGVSGEYFAIDLNAALAAVGEVIGTVDTEEILDSVFNQFCIGK